MDTKAAENYLRNTEMKFNSTYFAGYDNTGRDHRNAGTSIGRCLFYRRHYSVGSDGRYRESIKDSRRSFYMGISAYTIITV